MKITHPNTQSMLLMNEQCSLMAEIETHDDPDDTDADADFKLRYSSVMVGEIGHYPVLVISRLDWEGFKALVAEIDREWA
jgi:hypothetical protein